MPEPTGPRLYRVDDTRAPEPEGHAAAEDDAALPRLPLRPDLRQRVAEAVAANIALAEELESTGDPYRERIAATLRRHAATAFEQVSPRGPSVEERPVESDDRDRAPADQAESLEPEEDFLAQLNEAAGGIAANHGVSWSSVQPGDVADTSEDPHLRRLSLLTEALRQLNDGIERKNLERGPADDGRTS